MKIPSIGKAKLNIITTLFNQLVTTLCGIVVPRVLIGSFGSEVYGLSVSITQFLSYITLLESGIGGVARAKLYDPLAKNDYDEISKVYVAIRSFFRYVAAAFLIYSITLGLVYHDIAHVSIFTRTYIFILVIVISLSTLAKYMGGLSNLTLIVADQKQYINNIILMVTTLINTVAIVILSVMKCDLIWVKLGSSLIFITRPILYFYYVKKHYPLSTSKNEKAVLEQKWTGLGQHIAYFFHTNIDVVLLTLFSDARYVAVYSVYYLVVSSIRAITESFSGGMEAAFGELIAKKQMKKLWTSYRWYSNLINSTTLVLFGCTGILIVSFVRIYTQGIVDANYIQPEFAFVLVIVEAINCLALPCASLPIAANHLKQTRWGAYGEALINLIISCMLIRWNPLLGVAIGTLIATIFRITFYILYSSKHILHISAPKALLRVLLTLFALISIICVGRFILRFIMIDSFFKWIVSGIVTFIVVCLPIMITMFYIRKKISRVKMN